MCIRDSDSGRPGESSSAIRDRVVRARALAAARLPERSISCNAEIPAVFLRKVASPTSEAVAIFEFASRKMGLSARAIHRALKVARTIADLADSERVEAPHAAEAIGYRALDRIVTDAQI